MDYPLYVVALCTLASIVAGAMNSIAGGGTVLTFPALMIALDPLMANGTSTIALLPGSMAGAWGFRRQLADVKPMLMKLIPPCLLGGIVGSLLVVMFPQDFSRIFPWLMLLATLLFLVQKPVQRWTGTGQVGTPKPGTLIAIIGLQFVIAVYGGYFGAGMGILMIATLGFMGFAKLTEVNAVKTVLASIINAVTVVIFVREGIVVWQLAIPMAAGAIAGGYLGARLALKLSKDAVRNVVVAIGVTVTVYFFYKQFS